MLNKFKSIIFSPILTLKKIFYKIQTLYLVVFYNKEKYSKKQNEVFSEYDLDREQGLKKYQSLKSKDYTFDTPMSSEHAVLLASLSLSNQNFKKILEIGTYDGKNAYYLSKIFPDSKITTIDLEENDDLFINSYNRDNKQKRDEFCKERDRILSLSGNIEFKKMNSLNLSSLNETFDLIWVDGAHGYPYVTIDIINSIRLLSKEGFLLCDDVWKTEPLSQDETYHSIAAYKTLLALKKANILRFNMIYKRLDKNNNANKKFRKFIAIVKKFSND